MNERMIGSEVATPRCGALSGLLLSGLLAAAPAAAQVAPEPSVASRAWDQLAHGGAWGKLTLDTRLRLEVARVDPSRTSQAVTWRTRLGYRTPVWRGFSGFAEGEGVLPFDRHTYWDGIGRTSGRSLIADPPVLQVNRAFVKFASPETRTEVIAGRQRITLDDQRFVGNVGWRQNEQTYDSASFATGLGVEKLDLFYGFLWDVHRVFGDKETGPAATRDFDVDAHLCHASYTFFPELQATAFAYFLDFEDAAAFVFSSNSYGGRVTGSHAIDDDFRISYRGSYALQTDAGKNPQDYVANYVLVDAELGYAPLGALGAAYERLGSDHGRARFVTPLATLHAWNGWADAFLNNGGVRGLQDISVHAAPRLPLGLSGKLVFHHFLSAYKGTHLGDEYDAVLSKAVNEHLTLLTKGALLDATRAGPPDTWRFWLEATFQF